MSLSAPPERSILARLQDLIAREVPGLLDVLHRHGERSTIGGCDPCHFTIGRTLPDGRRVFVFLSNFLGGADKDKLATNARLELSVTPANDSQDGGEAVFIGPDFELYSARRFWGLPRTAETWRHFLGKSPDGSQFPSFMDDESLCISVYGLLTDLFDLVKEQVCAQDVSPAQGGGATDRPRAIAANVAGGVANV